MKRLFVVIAIIVAALLVLNGVMALRVESQLQSRLSKLRAAGAPASIRELAPRPAPNSDNAAFQVRGAGAALKAFDRDYAGFAATPAGKAYDEANQQAKPLGPEQIEAIRRILDAHPEVDAAFKRAAECRRYTSQLNYALPHVQFLQQCGTEAGGVRAVARYVRWRMLTLSAEGEHDEALTYGIALLRLSRLFSEEPAIVNHLVAIAVRGVAIDSIHDVLAAGAVESGLRQSLDEELAMHDSHHFLAHCLTTERAVVMDSIDRSPSVAGQVVERYFGWRIREAYLGALDYFEEALAALNKRTSDHVKRKELLWAINAGNNKDWVASSIAPAGQALLQAHYRTLALVRALRVFNALQAYAATNGQEADSLNDLKLPAGATIDPFTGNPLITKFTKDGWTVYSIGDNRTDDGGSIDDMKDYGVGPAK